MASKPDFPRVFRVRQNFSSLSRSIDDASSVVREQLAKLSLEARIRPGQSIAITAGSRGIYQIGTILRAAVDHFKDLGGVPFIVPAMGSHGGASADGQLKVLSSLGVTEQACGCPIRASMETVVVCESVEGFPVHFDKLSFEADHVLVCNRVKPHTRFTGELQSGLMKMMLIGLGKHRGAEVYHGAIQDYDFSQIVRSVGQVVLKECRIVGGLAIVENAEDRTAWIEAVQPEDFETREPELLQMAEQSMARLPFEEADVLLINEIGKNISGTGMDTNVVGRKHNDHAAVEGEKPRIRYIIVRGLTAATQGNATGIGGAEFTLRRVVDAIDPVATATNCVTSNHPTFGMIPIAFDTDEQVLRAALSSIGLRPPSQARLVWIQNTLDLAEMECSESLWNDAQAHPELEILTELRALPFDAQGNLPTSFAD